MQKVNASWQVLLQYARLFRKAEGSLYKDLLKWFQCVEVRSGFKRVTFRVHMLQLVIGFYYDISKLQAQPVYS